MIYIIKGSFITGDKWEESARNKKELAFVLDKIEKNTACKRDYIITDKNGHTIENKPI